MAFSFMLQPNNVVTQTPDAASQAMDDLIAQANKKSGNMAILIVIQKHDNQVSPSKIIKFNKSLHNL